MDLKLLEEFMYLSKDLNFTKTAERCYISQSVLSRHIQALEAELGCQLFVRDKRGLRLTDYGESFANSCKKIDSELMKALAELDNIKGGFTEILRIAYISPLATGLIDKAYALQLERYPQVKLDLMASWEERAMVLLNQNKVNMSIFMVFDELDPDIFSALPLYRDHYIVLVPEDHRLASKDSITLKDLENETLLVPSSRDFPVQYLQVSNIMNRFPDINVRASLNNKHDAVALANAGRGIPLVRSHVVNKMPLGSLKPISVIESDLEFDMCAVWKNENYTEPLVGFLGILEDLKKEGLALD